MPIWHDMFSTRLSMIRFYIKNRQKSARIAYRPRKSLCVHLDKPIIYLNPRKKHSNNCHAGNHYVCFSDSSPAKPLYWSSSFVYISVRVRAHLFGVSLKIKFELRNRDQSRPHHATEQTEISTKRGLDRLISDQPGKRLIVELRAEKCLEPVNPEHI